MICGSWAVGGVSYEALFLRVPKRKERLSLRLSCWMTGASEIMRRNERCYIVSMWIVLTLASCKPGFGFSKWKEAAVSCACCRRLRNVDTSRA